MRIRKDARTRGHKSMQMGSGSERIDRLLHIFLGRSAKRTVLLAYGPGTLACTGSSIPAIPNRRAWFVSPFGALPAPGFRPLLLHDQISSYRRTGDFYRLGGDLAVLAPGLQRVFTGRNVLDFVVSVLSVTAKYGVGATMM